MIDESRQYREQYEKAERTAEQRRKDLARAFDEIAFLQKKLRRVQIVNVALTSIVTALAMKGLEMIFQALQ